MFRFLAAVATPYRADGSINTDLYTAHVRRLLVSGCTGVLVGGSTGESFSLTIGERIRQLECLLEAGIPAECLLIGVGSCCLPDSRALVQCALHAGVKDMLWCPPFYYRPLAPDGLIAFLDRMISVPDGNTSRIWLYHIPRYSDVLFSQAVVEQLVNRFPSHITGLKDSGGDPAYTLEMMRCFPNLTVCTGSEKELRHLAACGLAGVISASFNLGVAPNGVLPEAGGEPESEHLIRLEKRRKRLEGFPLIPAVKTVLATIDNESSWRMLRPPLLPLEEGAWDFMKQHVVPDTWLQSLGPAADER